MPKVFVYGPDASQGRMYDRIGPSDFVGAARLEGYRLVFDKPNMKNPREGLANIEAAAGRAVFGLVFELTRKQHDDFGGFFGGYREQTVDVDLERDGKSARESVDVWIARRTQAGLRPSRASLAATKKCMVDNRADATFVRELDAFEALDG